MTGCWVTDPYVLKYTLLKLSEETVQSLGIRKLLTKPLTSQQLARAIRDALSNSLPIDTHADRE